MTRKVTEFTEIPGLDGVSVVRHCGDSPTEVRHMHDSLCVGVVLSGNRQLLLDGVRHLAETGTVLVIPPLTAHACPRAGQCEYVMLSIPAPYLHRSGFDCPPNINPVINEPTLFDSVNTMISMATKPASYLERQGTLLEMLSLLCIERCGEMAVKPTSGMVAETRRYLEERYAEEVPLRELARIAGCSPCRLNRVFASAVGMPPHQYQSLQKVQRVKRCIRDGLSLAESAAEAGFVDQSHMSRCFKRVVGMTPGAFAQGVTVSKSSK